MAAKKKNNSVDLAPQPDPRAPLDGALLLSKAQGLLAELEADLLARARGSAPVREALRARHEAERAARRTADPLEVWERHFVTQVAASWLLSCVFVRTLEDRGLLGHNRIAGPGALDSQRLFFELAPSLTEREYLLTIFRELSRLPAARDLFDARHNPVWMLGPSAEMAKKLVALFRTPNADAPGLRFGQADTRFLGDLYQDLSADVRERFALLQTPHFVEKYILDRTLERAIARFGLDETTLIDPTCGSGHFLLGAFERLVDHRLRKEPGLDVRDAARRALDAVYGADINPYAVAIARFRLTLEFLQKAGYARLADAPALPLHLVVADSLLHNPQHAQAKLGELTGQSMQAWAGDEFALDDEQAARDVLYRRFAAVVGNPPYITAEDPVRKGQYKELYRSCYGEFTLATPFVERFFQLAKAGAFVGMITESGFMKRPRGKKLVEDFLPTVNLDGVVNTSGADIPGHGTPTVLLFGSAEQPQSDRVVTVLHKRDDPRTASDRSQAPYWTSIVQHGHEIAFDNDYISVADIPRTTMAKHPWNLGGGGATELKELLEERALQTLADLIEDKIGFASFSGEDDVFIAPSGTFARLGVSPSLVRSLVRGEDIRDWIISPKSDALAPYDEVQHEPVTPQGSGATWHLWRYRSLLKLTRSGITKTADGTTHWWEWYRWVSRRYAREQPIVYAYVATHGHFAIGEPRQVFRGGASVAVIQVRSTSPEDRLALLAYLNSSAASFWMKQHCHNKTNASQKHTTDPARSTHEFGGTGLAAMPVPKLETSFMARLATGLSGCAKARSEWLSGRQLRTNHSAWQSADALRSEVQAGWERYDATTARAVCLQEELDWTVYKAFGLADATVSDRIFESTWHCALGSRPFESATGYIDGVSERARNAGQSAASPAQQPASVVSSLPTWWEGRRERASGARLGLLETRAAKRMWRDTEQNVEQAQFRRNVARGWCETAVIEELERLVSIGESLVTVRELSAAMEARGKLVSTVAEYIGEDASALVSRLALEHAVPFLAAYRHTESGIARRREWEKVWELQRREDAGDSTRVEAPPPRYEQKDFRDSGYWRLRGELDLPKECFISYPGCESDEDKEPVYGWAGWNHLQQALALAKLYMKRKDEGRAKERLAPMLAGLLELVPWVKQWHNDDDPDYGGRRGDYFESFLDNECHALGLTREDLRAWRPAEKAKGKKAEAKKAAGAPAESEDGEPRPAPKPRGRKKKAPTEATDT